MKREIFMIHPDMNLKIAI